MLAERRVDATFETEKNAHFHNTLNRLFLPASKALHNFFWFFGMFLIGSSKIPMIRSTCFVSHVFLFLAQSRPRLLSMIVTHGCLVIDAGYGSSVYGAKRSPTPCGSSDCSSTTCLPMISTSRSYMLWSTRTVTRAGATSSSSSRSVTASGPTTRGPTTPPPSFSLSNSWKRGSQNLL